MKKLHIHFICRGNVYRSRIAEHYFKSLDLPNVIASSSGVEAGNNQTADITSLPLSMAHAIGTSSWAGVTWRETTQRMIDDADILVFLNRDIERDVRSRYFVGDRKTVTWNVPNHDEIFATHHTSAAHTALMNDTVGRTTAIIHKLADTLAASLQTVDNASVAPTQSLRVHFICRGNVYRSRIAEQYLQSLQLPGIIVTSSGIDADKNMPAVVAARPVAAMHAIGEKLGSKTTWRQTTQKLIDAADLIIFMNGDILLDAHKRFTWNPDKVETWNIKDWDEQVRSQHISLRDVKRKDRIVGDTVAAIHARVDALAHDITVSGVHDVVSEHNRPRGYRLPLAWIDRKGLWYRGCHAVVATADHKIVVEKRSHEIFFAPDLLDITFGGGIEAGEEPRHAVLREGTEELGIDLAGSAVYELGVAKVSEYHRHRKMRINYYLYSYLIVLPMEKPAFKAQRSEVAAIRVLGSMPIKTLLRNHRIAHFGRLNTAYAYYHQVLNRASYILKWY